MPDASTQSPRGAVVITYLVAAAAVAGAWLIRIALQPWLGDTVPYLQFFPAILLAGWYGGLGPGLLATVLSASIAVSFFRQLSGAGLAAPGNLLSLVMFAAVGASIAWITHLLRASTRAQREAAELANAKAERLDAVFRTSVDGIIVIDTGGLIESFNPGAEHMFGYPESEVLGRNVSMLMPSPDHDRHDSYLQRYLASGDPKIIGIGREVAGRRRDGSTFPLHLSVGEMTLGGARKFTGMLHDLSRRASLEAQLRASDAKWQAVIESAVDGIIVIDEHGRVEALNPAAVRLFDYPETEVIGRNVSMLMPSPFREEHDRYLSRYLATGDAKIIGIGREVTGRKRDGSTFPLHLSVGEVTIAGARRFTGILHDLSSRVQMEERLREQNALARLGEMASVLAHEIKNPLAGIRGVVQIISRRMTPGSTDQTMMNEIVSRIDALDGMMKDLLVFARPPQPKLHSLDVFPLVQLTAALIRQGDEMRDLDVQVTGAAPPIRGDAEMLKMVFQNLLINGAHATKGKGTIRVDVSVIEDACSIVFSDNGPGIPADVRAKIFTPFFTTKSRGTGLGLPTAKRFVEAHNGHISVECPASGGTAVHVRLPLTAA